MAFLDNYRVLDLTDERGLLAGRLLADLGADVIQVELPGGSTARLVPPLLEPTAADPGGSAFWEAYACNKRGVTLDLDSVAGQEAFRKLCLTADFLFESEQTGTMARRGLSFADLHRVNPRLVYVSITPFGSDGPKASYADTELICWAAGGPLFPNREEDRAPLRISLPQAYLHAAADAVCGALIAHFAAVQTGRGQHVDISVQESVAQATLSRILAAAVGDHFIQQSRYGAPPVVHGKKIVDQSGSGSQTGRTKWQVKDGYVEFHLAVGPATGQFTNNFLAWLIEEGACDEPIARLDWRQMVQYIADGEVAQDAIERVREQAARFLAMRTKRELLDASLSRRLLISPVNTIMDIAEDRHLAERDFFVDVEGSDGRRRRMPGVFAHGSCPALVHRRAAPLLGEHTSEVLADVQYTAGRELKDHEKRADIDLPLQDLKVVDLSWVVAGPMASRALADYGAQVVRVESSKRIDTARLIGPFHSGMPGVEQSVLYGNCNAGKLGIALNLQLPEARAVVLDLAQWADVVIEAFSPGVMARWGLDYQQLRKVNPGLVMLSTSLMGQTGPHSNFAGFGNVGGAMSGFQYIVGWPDRPPLGPLGPYTDYVGPRLALITLLAALDRRRHTGEGCYIDSAQAEAGIYFLSPALVDFFARGNVLERMGNRDLQMAPHGVYLCRPPEDSERSSWVAIAVRTDEEWRRLAETIGRAELTVECRFASAEGRRSHADLLDEAIGAWTATKLALEVETLLQSVGIPAHIAASTVDAMADPQLRHRGHFIPLDHPLHGTTFVERSCFHLSETPAVVKRCAPTMGRDSEFVLREILGYREERVAALGAAGALT